LGRRFRALKAWMTFRAFGRSGIESRVREHCRLARDLAIVIESEPHFSLSAPVVMAVVCFRYEPPGYSEDDIDQLNEIIAESVNATGRAYITYTELKGRTALRIGIGNIATQSSHVHDVWRCIVDIAKQKGPELKSTPARY
ncbi:MAG: pyridoxal-dependent decarboxylase, partial [Gemmatimonadales bacterium]